MVERDEILRVEKLNVTFHGKSHEHAILKNISFAIGRSTVLGITGVSGSGKSILAMTIMGLLDDKVMQQNGQIIFKDQQLIGLDEKKYRKIRGNKISIIFQSPLAALNPIQKCGDQIKEIIDIHQKNGNLNLKEYIDKLLVSCGLIETNRIYNAYPHELSGGQLQRVLIAMAIANNPELIIADEATSSLDKKTTKEIIQLLMLLKETLSCSILFITHDLQLIQSISDQILMIDNGEVQDVFENRNLDALELSTFTKSYLSANLSQDIFRKLELTRLEPMIKCIDITKEYTLKKWLFFKARNNKRALKPISFEIYEGSICGILGESGSGKSAIAKIMSGIEKPSSGTLKYDQTVYNFKSAYGNWNENKEIQMVFQDAFTSLNPKQNVRKALVEIISYFKLKQTNSDFEELALSTLQKVGLSSDELNKFPSQLSGGQRQRVSLAKMLLLNPKLIIFDESLSALDVFTQKTIMDLILDLNANGLTCIFISHDPKLIKYLCDHILILKNGEILYQGPTSDAFEIKDNLALKEVLGDVV